MWALVPALAALVAYITTLYPSVPGGDAGELITAAATGGIPHPPGYPLYVLITQPALWLPVGTVAWRANLVSALLTAAAVGLLAWSVERTTGRRWAGVAAAAALGLSPTIWLYAVSAEVFALNTLIIAGAIAVASAFHVPSSTGDHHRRATPDRLIDLSASLFGLGLANHLTSLFFTAPLLASMLWTVRRDASWRSLHRWGRLALLGAAGLVPYLYLPVAHPTHPMAAWGDPSTLSGLLTHLLRREYGTFSLNADLSAASMGLGAQLGYYLRDLVHQVSWVGVAAALWGLTSYVRRAPSRRLALATVGLWAVYLVFFHALASFPLDQPLFHGVVARFWMAPNLVVCLWIGWGIAALPLPRAAVIAIALAVAGGQPLWHGAVANHRQNTVVRDFGRGILTAAPPDALLLVRGDLISNATRYLHVVEGLRPDVRLLDVEMLTSRWMNDRARRLMPDVTLPGTYYDIAAPGTYVLRALVDANIGARPVMVCGGLKPGDPSVSRVYRLVPLGYCDRLIPLNETVDVDAWLHQHDSVFTLDAPNMRATYPPDAWEHVAIRDHWSVPNRVAAALLTLAIERGDDPALLRRAVVILDNLLAQAPLAPPYAYKNLGLAWAKLMPHDPSALAKAREAWQHYLRVGPADDPQRQAIADTLRQWPTQ